MFATRWLEGGFLRRTQELNVPHRVGMISCLLSRMLIHLEEPNTNRIKRDFDSISGGFNHRKHFVLVSQFGWAVIQHTGSLEAAEGTQCAPPGNWDTSRTERFHRLRLFVHPARCWSNIHSNTMATVVDTKLYDILGVSPSATENELKKVMTPQSTYELRIYITCLFRVSKC